MSNPKPTLDERKFREFYVNETEHDWGYSLDYWSRSQREEHKIFHVIEYAAIAEMQAEVDKLKELTSAHKAEEMFWFKRAKEYEAEIDVWKSKYNFMVDSAQLNAIDRNKAEAQVKKLREALEELDYSAICDKCLNNQKEARKALEGKGLS
jgi:hypothetical protein